MVLIQYNNTTTVLRPFVRNYPGEPVPEETPTHHPDHHPVFISFFHLPRSIASSYGANTVYCTKHHHCLQLAFNLLTKWGYYWCHIHTCEIEIRLIATLWTHH